MRGIRILTKHCAEVGPEDPQKWFYQLGKAVNCYHLLWHRSTEFNIKPCCWKNEKGSPILPEVACSHQLCCTMSNQFNRAKTSKKERCLTGSIWAESDLVSWIELPIYNGHYIITNHTSAGRRRLRRPLVQLSAWSSSSRKGGASTDLHGVHIQRDCLLVQGSGREVRTGNEIMITRGAVFTLESMFPILLLHAYTYGSKCQVILLVSCYKAQHCVNLSRVLTHSNYKVSEEKSVQTGWLWFFLLLLFLRERERALCHGKIFNLSKS